MIHGLKAMRIAATLIAFLLMVSRVGAHEDMIAPLVKVEKVYATPKPLGPLRIAYADSEGGKPQTLLVKCDLFGRSIPAEGLLDLPRPDWSLLSAAYSLTSFESGKWVERPYLYLVVPLHGPAGESWEQTWATFHFDANGKLTRKIKRFVPMSSPNAIRVLWEDWGIGSNVSAKSVLEAAQRK